MHMMKFHGYTIHHDGDFDGDVLIISHKPERRTTLPFDLLEELVAKAVKRRRIAKLESAGTREILG